MSRDTEPVLAGVICPAPDPETATADQIARYHFARAQGFWRALMDGPHWPEAALFLGSEYALGMTYINLADDVAREIYAGTYVPEMIGPDIDSWLKTLDVDPSQIKAFEPVPDRIEVTPKCVTQILATTRFDDDGEVIVSALSAKQGGQGE